MCIIVMFKSLYYRKTLFYGGSKTQAQDDLILFLSQPVKNILNKITSLIKDYILYCFRGFRGFRGLRGLNANSRLLHHIPYKNQFRY